MPEVQITGEGSPWTIERLRAEVIRLTRERDAARAVAAVLAHSYEHDSRPPSRMVAEGMSWVSKREG